MTGPLVVRSGELEEKVLPTVIQQAREERKQTIKKRYVSQNETLAHDPSVLP